MGFDETQGTPSPAGNPPDVRSPENLVLGLREAPDEGALTWRRAFAAPSLEERYQEVTIRTVAVPLRWLLLLIAVVWLLGYAIDREVAGSEANYRTLVWLRSALAPLVVASAAAFWASPAFLRRVKDLALMLCTGAVVVGPLVMVVSLPEPARVSQGAVGAWTASVVGACCVFGIAAVRFDATIGMLLGLVTLATVTILRTSWPGKGPLVFSTVVACVAGALCAFLIDRARREAFVAHRAADRERARSDALLRNVLPDPIATRLRASPARIADHFEDATVLFADLAGFTPLTAELTAATLVDLLDEIFSEFDDIARAHGLEKIKTIGDAYMVAGGIPAPRADHAVAVTRMALAMRDAIAARRVAGGRPLQIRIGIDSGPIVAGVIGKQKFIYDLWGDAANTASRMESHGVPGKIHVTAAVVERLGDAFLIEPRGTIQVKGKGEMQTAFVEPRLDLG